jgi:hypothetical protein
MVWDWGIGSGVYLPRSDVVGSNFPLVLALPMKLVVYPVPVVNVTPRELEQAWDQDAGVRLEFWGFGGTWSSHPGLGLLVD